MLKSYFAIAIRNLRKHKGYALINILGLAIGLACCISILRIALLTDPGQVSYWSCSLQLCCVLDKCSSDPLADGLVAGRTYSQCLPDLRRGFALGFLL